MLPSFISLPLHSNIRCTTLGGTGSTQLKSQARPFTSLTGGSDTLKERVSTAMVVLRKELSNQPAGFQLLTNKLREAITQAVDLGLLTTISEDAGVATNNATSNHAADLETAVSAITTVGEVLLDASEEAAIQMDDNPSEPPQPLRSLLQDNLAAIRLRRYWGFTLLSPNAAAIISGATA